MTRLEFERLMARAERAGKMSEDELKEGIKYAIGGLDPLAAALHLAEALRDAYGRNRDRDRSTKGVRHVMRRAMKSAFGQSGNLMLALRFTAFDPGRAKTFSSPKRLHGSGAIPVDATV
jgi:hypothetical protein